MRGEIKLTYKTFPLNGETSDTNDNVKTKINTKHMKPDNDVTRCSRVCVISSMHEVSVSFDLPLHHLHLPPLIPHQPQAVLTTLLLLRG